MRAAIIAFCVLLMFAGCSRNGQPREQQSAVPPKEGNIKITGADSLKKIIENRNGKILFINAWATWCIPCVEEFPALVKISEEYKDRIDFLSLSADSPADIEKAVVPFLKKQKAYFPVFVMNEQESDSIINMLNKKWSGALPATFIYDASGKQQVFLLGAETYESFKEKINSVLQQ